MSAHIEWFSDPHLWIADPLTIDHDGSTNEETALIVEQPFDGDCSVIEIDPENYKAFATRLRQIADALHKEEE